jgi:UDP-N-acetylmuramoylalanine--D-glutamate ligase
MPGDTAVVPVGDRVCVAQARRGRGKIVSFGADADYAPDGRSIVETASGDRFSLDGIELHGRHNAMNAAAAIASARALAVPSAAIVAGLSRFQPLPHRMALAGVVGGVHFYDDSKGTNVGAAVTALLGLSEARGVLIAGGRDKLGSYEPLVRALEEKGRALVVLGEAAERIATAAGQRVPLERASSMDDAVERAYRMARPGDAVLLSPACSSFDMFSGYAERGDRFVRAVARLVSEGREASA